MMKREDERISTLFQQLREEDERHAPSFAHDWSLALSRWEKPRRRWAVWRLAAGAAALIVLGAGWWMFSPSPAPVTDPPNATPWQPPLGAPQPPAILISEWRSPTEFLLRIPGEELLRRVPRLDESLVNIKAIIPDQN